VVVLLTGASGFIGRHLSAALLAAGHEVVCAVRDPARHARTDTRMRCIAADFTRDTDPAVWRPRLAGVDAVINAVGIVRERGAQTFETIHDKAPRALFAACAQSGVQLVLQVSALGADDRAESRYHRSKKAADDFLASLPLASIILQPSLVYGADGTSARLFATLASLPLIAVPGGGVQMVQPLHIDDTIAAVMALLERSATRDKHCTRVPLVGPAPLTLKNFLATLRQGMGLRPAWFLAVPMPLMRLTARVARLLPGSLLEPETLRMLERGNTGDPATITALLGKPPRAPEQFIAPQEKAALRRQAKLNWLLPMLRMSIAVVWIATGLVSLGLYPVADSYALLARTGITGAFAPVMLYGAALLDFAFGIATLAMKKRRALWLAQIALIVFYTVVISFRLPEFWLHPYGPLLKNLPMLAALWLLLELEEE
jgi:uncharacterized protein YbjT (DUF2867 family)